MFEAIVVVVLPVFLISIALFTISLFSDGWRLVILASCVAIVGITVIPFVGCIGLSNAEWKTESVSTENIVALADNNMVNGRIYLHHGYINEDLWYQYMTELNSGGFKSNKVPETKTTIFYDSNNPRVESYKMYRKFGPFCEKDKFYKIYIPEGSINNAFNVDLQ